MGGLSALRWGPGPGHCWPEPVPPSSDGARLATVITQTPAPTHHGEIIDIEHYLVFNFGPFSKPEYIWSSVFGAFSNPEYIRYSANIYHSAQHCHWLRSPADSDESWWTPSPSPSPRPSCTVSPAASSSSSSSFLFSSDSATVTVTTTGDEDNKVVDGTAADKLFISL